MIFQLNILEILADFTLSIYSVRNGRCLYFFQPLSGKDK